MSVRIKRWPNKGIGSETYGADDETGTIADRETTVDGQTFHWGPNEVRNFLDDSVGERHAAFDQGQTDIVQDTIPFGQSHS